MRSFAASVFGRELPDRQERPTDRQGVDYGVDTRAVGQTGVHHRRRLIDAPADITHDLVDDTAKVRLAQESSLRVLDLPLALYVDAVGSVHHDLTHLGVIQVRLNRAVAKDVVGNVLAQSGPVCQRQRSGFVGQRGLELT